MTFIDVLHWISVGTLLFYAVASIIKPKFVAQNLEHSLNTGRGISEFRILHGGFFLGLGVFALYTKADKNFTNYRGYKIKSKNGQNINFALHNIQIVGATMVVYSLRSINSLTLR